MDSDNPSKIIKKQKIDANNNSVISDNDNDDLKHKNDTTKVNEINNIDDIQEIQVKEPELNSIEIDINNFDDLFLDPQDTATFIPANQNESTEQIDEIDEIDELFNTKEPDIDEAIQQALNEINQSETFDNKFNNFCNSISPESISSLDSPNLNESSITSNEDDLYIKQEIKQKPIHVVEQQELQYKEEDHFITSNILSIKQKLINSSKLISTFTVLKTTYLKLCKEFNYLLEKFNNNEKIKIELINENNNLKKLINELINEKIELTKQLKR